MDALTYIFVNSVTEENWQLSGKTVITLSPVDRNQGRNEDADALLCVL